MMSREMKQPLVLVCFAIILPISAAAGDNTTSPDTLNSVITVTPVTQALSTSANNTTPSTSESSPSSGVDITPSPTVTSNTSSSSSRFGEGTSTVNTTVFSSSFDPTRAVIETPSVALSSSPSLMPTNSTGPASPSISTVTTSSSVTAVNSSSDTALPSSMPVFTSSSVFTSDVIMSLSMSTPASSSVVMIPSTSTPVSSSAPVSLSMSTTPASSSVVVSPSTSTPVSFGVPASLSVSTTPASSSVAVSPSMSPAPGIGSDNSGSLPLVIGGVASIVVLVFANILQLVLCYFSTSKGYDFIHINIVVGLMCGLIFLLVGSAEAIWSNSLTCKVFSGLTTYFLLVPFVWFLAESVFMNFYIRGIATGKYQIVLMLLIFCFCWLLPALVSVVTGVVADGNTISIGPDRLLQQCWLSVNDGSIAAFLAPLAVLSLVTVALCLLLGWTLYRKKLKYEEQKLRKSVIYGLQCVAVVLPLMTVTWVIASLYVGLGITALGWIYLVLLIITAVAIFIMYGIVKVVPLIVKKLDKNHPLYEEDKVEMAAISDTLTYKVAEDPPDNNKTEDNVAAGAVGAAGVSTFKPGAENGAAEATLEGEGANAGGKTVDGDKKEDEGKQADLEGNSAQGERPTEFSTFKPSGLVAAGDALKSEPVKVEESGGKGSSTDQATAPQAGTPPKSDPTEGTPKVAKANGTDGPSLAMVGKTEEVPKDVPVVEEGKDQGDPSTKAVSDSVPADKVDN